MDFFEEDLALNMPDYIGKFIHKSEKTKQGEGILLRSDRFKFIESYDIILNEEIKSNSLFEKMYANICQNEEVKNRILSKRTVVQVTTSHMIRNYLIFVYFFVLFRLHMLKVLRILANIFF